jgi:hypothetical protein
MDAESLYSCGFSACWRLDSAWLTEALLGRLLPVCCPDSSTVSKTSCVRLRIEPPIGELVLRVRSDRQPVPNQLMLEALRALDR